MGGFKQLWKAKLKHHSYYGYQDPDFIIYYGSYSVTDSIKYCYRDGEGKLHEDIGDLIYGDDSNQGNYSIIDILYGLYHFNDELIEYEEVHGDEYFEVRNFLENKS